MSTLGTDPEPPGSGTVVGGFREKKWSYAGGTKGACELCGAPFERTARTRHKRFCSERHRKLAEKARYAERHIERAVCKGCGAGFERSVTSKRKQVYCTLDCQAESRSREYREREDIRPPIPKASTRAPSEQPPPTVPTGGAWGPTPGSRPPDRVGGRLALCTDSGGGQTLGLAS